MSRDLYGATGQPVHVDRLLARRGEGEVYTVRGDSDAVLKLFLQPSSERTRKLEVMLATPPDDPSRSSGHCSICWPQELVYDARHTCVGFLMPRIKDATTLGSVYNTKARLDTSYDFHWKYLVTAATNLSNTVRALHKRGYVIGDIHDQNVLVKKTAMVSAIDCDSMQVPRPGTPGVFRCTVGNEEYTPPELQRVEFSRVDREPYHDAFGLSVLLFRMLVEGWHPFSGSLRGAGETPSIREKIGNGWFPFGEPCPVMPPRAARFDIVPVEIQELFRRCFNDGARNPRQRPSAHDWNHALSRLCTSLRVCSANINHWYSNHLSTCPWCDKKRRFGSDPFPLKAPQSTRRSPTVHHFSLKTAPVQSLPIAPPVIPTILSTPVSHQYIPTYTPPPASYTPPVYHPSRSSSWQLPPLIGMLLIFVIAGALTFFFFNRESPAVPINLPTSSMPVKARRMPAGSPVVQASPSLLQRVMAKLRQALPSFSREAPVPERLDMSFGRLIVANGVTKDRQPINSSRLFSELDFDGAHPLAGFVSYANVLPRKTKLQLAWDVGSIHLESSGYSMKAAKGTFILFFPGNVRPGDYTVTLIVDGVPKEKTTFTVTPRPSPNINPLPSVPIPASADPSSDGVTEPVEPAQEPTQIPPIQVPALHRSVTYHAIHKHAVGSCKGDLTLSDTTAQFVSNAHPQDSRTFLKKNLTLDKNGFKERGGKNWHFDIEGANSLGIFQEWLATTTRANGANRQ